MPFSTGHSRIETGLRAVTILTRVIHTHTERPLRLGLAMVWRTRICVGMLAPPGGKQTNRSCVKALEIQWAWLGHGYFAAITKIH